MWVRRLVRRGRHQDNRRLSNEIPKTKIFSRAEKDADYWNVLDVVGRNQSFKQEIFEYLEVKKAEICAIQLDDPHMERNLSFKLGEVDTLLWIIYNVITRSNENDQLRSMSTKPKES